MTVVAFNRVYQLDGRQICELVKYLVINDHESYPNNERDYMAIFVLHNPTSWTMPYCHDSIFDITKDMQYDQINYGSVRNYIKEIEHRRMQLIVKGPTKSSL